MLEKVNLFGIVKDHCGTLKKAGSLVTSKGDISLFFGLPLIFAVAVTFTGFDIDKDFVNIVITALSILIGLLLNLLVLIYDVVTNKEKDVLKQEVLRQTFANISFSILISLIAIALLLVPSFIKLSVIFNDIRYINYIKLAYEIVIVFLITSFGLHLMMILKRVHRLLSREVATA